MEKQFPVQTPDPLIILTVQGDFKVKGYDEQEILIKYEEEVQVSQEGDTFTIVSTEDCSLRVPRQSRFQIQAAHGDAEFKALEGEISIDQAHGDLRLRSVGPVTVHTLHGNLQAKNLSGSLEIGHIDGNVTVRDLQGDLRADSIDGNVVLKEVDGVVSAKVGGNFLAYLDPMPAQEHRLEADGNLNVYLPKDTSAKLHFERVGGRVMVTAFNGEKAPDQSPPFDWVIGDGDAEIFLSAGGNVMITGSFAEPDFAPETDFDFEGEFDGIADEITQQVSKQVEIQMKMLEQQMNAMAANLSASMGAAGLSKERIEHIQQRARETAERASQRTQERMQQAQERLERRMVAHQQRAMHKAKIAETRMTRKDRKSWGFSWPPMPDEPPMPPEPAVSEEERLLILKMLEQKKISLAEAEKLLSALEGRGME
jgi:hypothetical protein